MFEFWIAFLIAFMIFVVLSSVLVRRRRRIVPHNVGYVINDNGTPVVVNSEGIPQTHFMYAGAPVTQYTPDGVPVTVYPPPNYQQSYASATYPAPTSTHMTVQLTAVQLPQSGLTSTNPAMQQRCADNATTTNTDPTVLPRSEEKRALHEMHTGAGETVNHI